MIRLSLVVLSVLLAACPGRREKEVSKPNGGGVEPDVSTTELRSQLESSVLEILGQLTLGNIETYADGLRRDEAVTLIGAELGKNFVGDGRDAVGLNRWPLLDRRPEFLSKNLDLYVSPRGEVGWSYDEVSLRIPIEGREASVPLRLTLVFTRDVDRWVVALDHWSFPLAVSKISAAARAGQGTTATALQSFRKSPDADTLLGIIGRLENGDPREREQRLSRRAGSVLVLPGIDGEYRGPRIDSSPTLLDLFEGARTVGVRDHRIESTVSGDMAWIAANLVVRGDEPEPFEVELRATYVLEHSDSGWKVVHSHVSVPMPKGFFTELLGLD